MTKIKAAIFDLDGVIVDTAKFHYLAWKRLAKKMGFEFTQKDNERLKGVSRMQSLEILLQVGGVQLSDKEKQAAADKKNKWYVEYISKVDKSNILPGVEKFLQDLRRHEIKIALGSASKNSMIILNNLELVHYFDAIVDGNKISKAKPDPEVFLLAAEELKCEPMECVVFEDAEAGIEAALLGNMKAIGIGSPEVLSKAHKVMPDFNNAQIELLNF